MKLKTLEDIGKLKRECCSIEDCNNICEKCIKQEAIKWMQLGINNLKKYPNNEKYSWMESGVRQFILEFFNITEEDLK